MRVNNLTKPFPSGLTEKARFAACAPTPLLCESVEIRFQIAPQWCGYRCECFNLKRWSRISRRNLRRIFELVSSFSDDSNVLVKHCACVKICVNRRIFHATSWFLSLSKCRRFNGHSPIQAEALANSRQLHQLQVRVPLSLLLFPAKLMALAWRRAFMTLTLPLARISLCVRSPVFSRQTDDPRNARSTL